MLKHSISLRPHKLELLGTVNELVRVRLRYDRSLIRLLHKILIPLLICEPNGVFFRLEPYSLALHEVSRRLPAYQRVLPSMSFG